MPETPRTEALGKLLVGNQHELTDPLIWIAEMLERIAIALEKEAKK